MAAASGGVELIEFVRPFKKNINLYITGISKKLDADEAQIRLTQIFSKFGLVYEVQVFDGLESAEATVQNIQGGTMSSSLYAFVKFYSTRAAANAQAHVNGKWLIDGQFLKVQFATRKKSIPETPASLYMAKCTELANYYLGFAGWSTHIISIDPASEDCPVSCVTGATFPMYRCIVRLEVKDRNCYCDGIGYGGDKTILDKEKDPIKRIELIGIAKKVAHRHAFENAFRRVLIIVLVNGKIGVEINKMDITELEMNDVNEDVVHVNYIDEKDINEDDDDDNNDAINDDDDDMIEALEQIANT